MLEPQSLEVNTILERVPKTFTLLTSNFVLYYVRQKPEDFLKRYIHRHHLLRYFHNNSAYWTELLIVIVLCGIGTSSKDVLPPRRHPLNSRNAIVNSRISILRHKA